MLGKILWQKLKGVNTMQQLTTPLSNSNLMPPLTHSRTQDWSLGNKRHKPLLRGIFMRKTQLHIVMLGLGKALVRVGGLVCSIRPTLSSSQHLDWSHRVGLKTLQTVATMSKIYAQNQLTISISVSTTKQNSLKKQVEIIGYSLDSFCLDSNALARATLKADALELVRMLNEIEQNNQRKTSLFNVLAKDTRRLIAEKVSFNQAKQYPGCIVKFSCMEVLS